jgi:hypothetical protein
MVGYKRRITMEPRQNEGITSLSQRIFRVIRNELMVLVLRISLIYLLN